MPSSAVPASDRLFANKVQSKDHKRKPQQKRKTGVQVERARARTGLAAALLDRHQIVALTGVSYPSLWKMACRGAFPKGRTLSYKTVWLKSEIDAWIAALPVSPIREQPSERTIKESETA
jgi:predicted DNA-binding transcriptional regulator AlpA